MQVVYMCLIVLPLSCLALPLQSAAQAMETRDLVCFRAPDVISTFRFNGDTYESKKAFLSIFSDQLKGIPKHRVLISIIEDSIRLTELIEIVNIVKFHGWNYIAVELCKLDSSGRVADRLRFSLDAVSHVGPHQLKNK